MFATQTNPNWAYEVLELSPACTDDEIKKAYRRMGMKYHPDKVNSLGEDVKQSATEKFRKVKDAYDHLKKERGF
jgi:DnaJ like chaperone protein